MFKQYFIIQGEKKEKTLKSNLWMKDELGGKIMTKFVALRGKACTI